MDMITLAMAKAYTDSVALPVVELSEETCMALLSGEVATLTGAEVAVFMAAKDNISPVVVKVGIGDMKMAVIAVLVVVDELMYIADTVGSGKIVFSFISGGMTARIVNFNFDHLPAQPT